MVSVGKLRPDPTQPRKHFDKENVEELAQSIKTTGLLKNIEADKDLVIVTGELRWRAAKEAGLREVPVRTVKVTPEERRLRQLHENIHHYGMSPIETAEALRQAFPEVRAGAQVGRVISRALGKSEHWVSQHLSLFQMPATIRQAIDKRELPMDAVDSIVRVASLEKEGKTPKGIAQAFKKKVERGDIKSKDAVRSVARAISENPGAAREYLKASYRDKDVFEVQATLDKIAPTFTGQKYSHEMALSAITAYSRRLEKLLKGFPFEDFGIKRQSALDDLRDLRKVMAQWHKDLR